jgi:Type II CAAX prenyl endopeptidase Rce1-like
MASRLAVVSVRPLGPPCGHGARHFPPTGRPGFVRCLGPSVRAHLPRGLRLCGPLFEEPGSRGFALHRQLHGPLIGDLILGSLWALWHLPRLSVPQMLPPSGTVMDFVTFSLALIALAYIIQWVFNNTGAACLWPS